MLKKIVPFCTLYGIHLTISHSAFSKSPMNDTPLQRDDLKPSREWVKDTDRKWCKLCLRKFSLFNRRYHCRMCGDVFCSACMTFIMIVVGNEPKHSVRICGSCVSAHKAKYVSRSPPMSSNLGESTPVQKITKAASVPLSAALTASAPGHRIRPRQKNRTDLLNGNSSILLTKPEPTTWRLHDLVNSVSFPDSPSWRYEWPRPPIPFNEFQRLEAIRAMDLSFSMPDSFCDMLCKGYECPMAGVTIIDDKTVHFKSRVGIVHEDMARHLSLDAHVICTTEPFVVLNMGEHRVFQKHPLYTMGQVKFYAAMPLVTHEGFAIGTVFVMDTKPRKGFFDRCLVGMTRMSLQHIMEKQGVHVSIPISQINQVDVTPRQVENILVSLLSKTNDIQEQLRRPMPEANLEKNWTKEALTVNDVYRDRLLVKEIELFVDLGDALGMSGPQRNVLFHKFLHLDWMRRSAITLQDLFLYCGLRRSRFADRMFEPPKNGFRQFENRFELVQLTCALFNFLTLPAPKVVQWVVAQMKEDVVVSSLLSDGDKSTPLRQEIAELLIFVYGTLSPNEKSLKSVLETLYLSPSVDTQYDFATSHGMTNLRQFLTRFPGKPDKLFLKLTVPWIVLIYPVFWIQRTLRRRIMGPKFWRDLQAKRESWDNAKIFYQPQELIDEANSRRAEQQRKIEDDGKSQILSKVLPIDCKVEKDNEVDKRVEGPYDFANVIQAYPNEEKAWEVTADNILSAIHIKQLQIDGKFSGSISDEYARISQALYEGGLTPVEVQDVRKSIVKQYGYNFADFVVGLSHLKEQQASFDDNSVHKGKQSKCVPPVRWEKVSILLS
ncbi:unnamed protein product [Aphanomyces euteiches]